MTHICHCVCGKITAKFSGAGSLPSAGLKERTQVARFSGECLYPLSHLTSQCDPFNAVKNMLGM